MTATGHTHRVEHPSTHGHLHVPGTSIAHRLAPETKLVGLFAFVVVVAITPRRPPIALAIDFGVVVALIAITHIPFSAVASRSLVILPFLIFAVLLPFIGRGTRTSVGPFTVSTDGAWAGWSIAAKAACGVGASVVLTATTPIWAIIEGLGRLHLPRLIVAILAFMFRYLDLVSDRLARMRQSMTARCYRPRWLWHARPAAAAAGALFVRSFERGERIHQAMLARGFNGTMPNLNPHPTRWRDLGYALIPASVAAVVLAWTALR